MIEKREKRNEDLRELQRQRADILKRRQVFNQTYSKDEVALARSNGTYLEFNRNYEESKKKLDKEWTKYKTELNKVDNDRKNLTVEIKKLQEEKVRLTKERSNEVNSRGRQ